MSDFEVGGNKYKTTRMNARVQFHVMRRMAPLFEAFSAASEGGTLDPKKLVKPALNALSSMKDEDCDYVLDACLACAQRQSSAGVGWSPVFVKGGGMMFQDLDMMAMMQIASNVVAESFESFFLALPSTSA